MFVRVLLIAVALVLVWGMSVGGSRAGGRAHVYVVQPTDTLWSIAVSHYDGDPREGVWRLQQRNGLTTTLLQPGQRLVVPP